MTAIAAIFPFLAARITGDSSALQQAGAFVRALFDSRIDSSDCVAWGAILLGVTCGTLGSFIVLRRQSLLGDAIGHSVLPGVCLGFLAAGGRDLPFLLGGALIAGLLAAALIGVLQRTTILKSGECMGLAFTGFYGLGIVLYKYILSGEHAGQSGLEKFLFGQIAGISLADVAAMGIVAALSLGAVLLFWRSLAVTSFDHEFAVGVGMPVGAINHLLTVLLTAAIVISIQAVGVVLVAAMLVTPAAAAYLLTDRLWRMVVLSALFGVVAGLIGAFLSLLVADAPTGAFMVLAASLVFATAFLLSPRHGLLPRLLRLWQRRRRTQAENLLRTLYGQLEASGAEQKAEPRFAMNQIATARRESPAFVRHVARWGARRGWLTIADADTLVLTDEGLAEAKRVVRNHRLWELFLTQEANLPADHVHADAEYIEHVLPRDVLHRLEQLLDRPAHDPHGRPIPAAAEAEKA